jgi:hypothetical protein
MRALRIAAVALVAVVIATGVPLGQARRASTAAAVAGELKRWHKVTLTFDGPSTSERATPNPFLDYRIDVTFRHAASNTTYRVPGYFAADGDAPNTSATAGNKWRVHLAPDHAGQWTYRVSFRQGPNVMAAESPTAGTAVAPIDGLTGSLTIAETDKTGRDFRAKGRLRYVNKHHLQHAGTGEYFLKVGSDSPENLFAYDDFDNTPNYTWTNASGEQAGGFRRDYAAHIGDWRSGDPTWKEAKGKGLIGAMNYLASKGLNGMSWMPYTTHGDDRNVSMYVNDEDRTRIDVSKVDQWEIVLEHLDRLGLFQDVKMLESENDWDHDQGQLGPERKLFYREMIARFGHHLGIKWNIGEENNTPRAARMEWASYIYASDPYKHLIVIHNAGGWDRMYPPLMGKDSPYRGASLQLPFYDNYEIIRYLRMASAAAGRPWVLTLDETRPNAAGRAGCPPAPPAGAPPPGGGRGGGGGRGRGASGGPGGGIAVACGQPDATPPDALDPEHSEVRKGGLWASIMAGGAGTNTYFGYGFPQGGDLRFSSYRPWSAWFDQKRHAHEFFVGNGIPFQDMSSRNEVVSSGWALAGTDALVVYLPGGTANAGSARLPYDHPHQGGLSAPGAGVPNPQPGGGPRLRPEPTPGLFIDLAAFKAGSYDVRWFDPRAGGALQSGSVTTLTGGEQTLVTVGQPPNSPARDWVVLIRPSGRAASSSAAR